MFVDAPLRALAAPYVRVYIGAPIVLPGTDLALGTVAVLDSKPWETIAEEKVKMVETLARQV